MKKLVKSTLLALGILPFSLFSDDAAENKKVQHYQVTSEVVFNSPNASVTQQAFAPFGPKKLGVAFDLNLDFYFYNLLTENVLNNLQNTDSETSRVSTHGFYTLNPRTMNQVDKVPLRSHHTANPVTDAIESIDAIDAMWARANQPVKTAPAKKPSKVLPPVKKAATPEPAPTPVAMTIPRPMVTEQSVFEPTESGIPFARLMLELQQGQYTGGQVDALIPVYGEIDNFFFANLVAAFYSPVYQTYSAGIGHRQVINNAIYGFYSYYDRQKSQANFYYNRVSGGVERLGMTWDLRANVYFYPNTPNNIQDLGRQSAFIKADSNNIYYNHFYDVKDISSGADVEIGRTLGLDNLRGYVAAYSFGQYVNGGRARVTYNINPHWQVNGMGQYDGGRGWLAMGGISYTIGNVEISNSIIDRIREPVIRDFTAPEVTINSYQQVDLDKRHIYFANAGVTGSTGTGTQKNPTSLDNAFTLAKPGDFIYLEGGEYAMTQKIQLQANQIFWGTGADLYTQGHKSAGGFLLLPKGGAASNLNAETIAGYTQNNCGAYICAIYANNTANYGGFNLNNTTTSTTTNNFVGILIGNASGLTFNEVNVSGFTTSGYNGYGIRIDDGSTGNANPIFTNISSNNNNIGLSIVNSGDVTIQGVDGQKSYFNDNTAYANGIPVASATTGIGIFVNSSTSNSHLTVKNVDLSGNYIGMRFVYANNALTPITPNIILTKVDSSNNIHDGIWISTGANVSGSYVIASNNGLTNTQSIYNYGVYMDGGVLNGDYFTLTGNTSLQLVVQGDANTIATLDHSSIIAAPNSQDGAVWVNYGSSIYLKNAVNVEGLAYNIYGTIVINRKSLPSEPTYIYNCSIKYGIGTCVAV